MQKFSASISGLQVDLNKMATYLQQASRAIEIFAPFLKELQRITATLEEGAARDREVEAFGANGLCLAPSMPDALVQEIVQKHGAGAKSPILRVLGYYRRNGWAELENTVEPWDTNRFFRARMHIFKDALWAHTRGRYTLSVAALTPHVEGLVLDWIFTFSRGDLKTVKNILEKKGGGRYTGNVVSKTIGQMAANALNREGWTSMVTLAEFANSHLYRRYRREKEHTRFLGQTSLARHPMVHGSSLRSGTALNSLRLFLALDVLTLVE